MTRKRWVRPRTVSAAITLALLSVGLLFIVVPYLWIFSTAFQNEVDAFALPPHFFFVPTLRNFATLGDGAFLRFAMNSVIITTLSTAVAIALGVPAGYGLATGRFRARNALGAWLLITYMAPAVVYIVPMFIIFLKLGLVNTYVGLILAYQTGMLPFATWMMRSYFSELPLELEEAARIDGCTTGRAFLAVILPVTLPGISIVALLVAVAAWGEFFGTLILGGGATYTAPVGIYTYISDVGNDFGAVAAATLFIVAPMLLATIVAQRGLLRALTSAAVKG